MTLPRCWSVTDESGQGQPQDPGAATAWGESIADGVKRENTLRSLYGHWQGSNASAADAWLAASPALGPEAKQRIKGK